MHKIVTEYAPFVAAERELTAAGEALANMEARIQQAQETHEREIQAGIRSGKLTAMPSPIDPEKVRSAVRSRRSTAESEVAAVRAREAETVIALLEQREREVLAKVLEQGTLAGARDAAAEVRSLAGGKTAMWTALQRKARQGPGHEIPTYLASVVLQSDRITAGAVVDAALTGGTLIGRSDLSPKPTPADFFSPESPAQLQSAGT